MLVGLRDFRFDLSEDYAISAISLGKEDSLQPRSACKEFIVSSHASGCNYVSTYDLRNQNPNSCAQLTFAADGATGYPRPLDISAAPRLLDAVRHPAIEEGY